MVPERTVAPVFSRYVCFELGRLLKTPKNIVVLFLFFACLLGFYGFNLYMNEATREDRPNVLGETLAEYHAELLYYRRLSETPTGGVIYGLLNDDMGQLNEQRMQASMLLLGPAYADRWRPELAAIIRRDEIVLFGLYSWREAYATENGLTEAEMSQVDFADSTLPPRYRGYSEASLMAQIQRNRYLENRDMQPVLSAYDMGGWQFLYRLVNVFGRFAIPTLVALLSADIFSAEKVMGSYKFLLLQPIGRGRIYLAKLTASFLLCTAVIFLFMLLLSGINAALNGLGEGAYPVPFVLFAEPLEIPPYDGNANAFLERLDPGHEMPAGLAPIQTYLLCAAGFIAVYILFLVAFTALISLFAGDSISALSVSLALVFASLTIGAYVPRHFPWGEFAWNPLEYADMGGLARGALGDIFWYPAAWFLGLAVIGMLCFRRRDMVC